jgi:DNA-binding NtrC family response regulator
MGPEKKPTGTWENAEQGSFEVLILEKDERIREGLARLLTSEGLLVTAMEDARRGLTLAAEKHFAVAILGMDTTEAEGGLSVMAEVRSVAPATSILMLASQLTFDVAVRAFRGGAVDVMAKLPESVRDLTQRVKQLCLEARRSGERDHLLHETLEVHEQFLKKLMEAARRAQQAEDLARGESDRWELKECAVLVVDENPRTGSGLQEALGKDAGYRIVSAVSGGEALDYASQQGFQIAMVNDRISDLPWRTLVRGLRRQAEGSIVLLLTEPDQGPGRVSIIEESQNIELIPELNRGSQLVEAIHNLREAYVAKNRERYYLQHFRKEHYDFLKRYVELRQKLIALLPEVKR